MWKRLRSFFLPSPGSMVFVWIALGLFVIISLTNTFLYAGDPTLPRIPMLSLVSLPMVSILLGLATVRERRPGGRLLLWSSIFACAVIGTLNIFIFSLSGRGTPDFNTGMATFLICPGIPTFGFILAVWGFLIWRTWPALRELQRKLRLERIISLVTARGEAALAEIAAEISMSETQTRALLLELIRGQELMALYDEEYQRVYSASALNERQRKMLGIISARGKIELGALSKDMLLNLPLLKQWIYTLARRGQLHGFADWAAGWVYSFPPGSASNPDGRCPHCGGEMDVAGKGVIQCAHCKVEVFQ